MKGCDFNEWRLISQQSAFLFYIDKKLRNNVLPLRSKGTAFPFSWCSAGYDNQRLFECHDVNLDEIVLVGLHFDCFDSEL